ncbi:type III ribulose-bisphosphate carboxylase [Candidatus Micrarchaeota archaeon CG10_big_fil_rev_8_21_14_0_10_45_29]|nr:MAG: type III ribulose-bisphosphate carboxylase [Candidatus Micrarchaeota archaeon CG10_big_fil_rev_8_21_14_0_10_45_29]
MAYGGYSDYLKLGWQPNKQTHLIAEFQIIPAKGKTLAQAAQATAAESSIGTWTSLSTMQGRVLKKLQAKAFFINKSGKVKIAYPTELFEPNNIPQILSDIAGNIFGMKEIDALRFEDFSIPNSYANTFPGPKYGVEGVRKIAGTTKTRRPHLGTIVKPKVGLTPKEGAKVAYDSWVGGLDLVKDDENLTSHPFSRFEERLSKMLEAKDKAQEETGSPKIYCPNITAPAHTMLKRAELAQDMGSNCIMIDILTAGFSGVQFIRHQNFKMLIHAHRAMHAAITRNKQHGISMLALSKMARMAGCDQLHIGAIFGKMEGEKKEVLQIHDAINKKWANLKPVFSVASGGLSPLQVPDVMRAFGNDVIIQAGGGVHGHPQGTVAGAKAMCQAAEAAKKKISLKEYAKTRQELSEAIKKWGK